MAHAVVQAGGAAGDGVGVLGQGGAGAAHRHGLAAQAVSAVGQTAGHHAVGNQHHVIVTEGVEGEANHSRMDVHAVGDQLHHGTVFQGGDDGAGFAVGDAGHGVVQVGHVVGTGGKSSLGGVIVGAGVGDGNAHFLAAFLDEIQVARLFRGHVHQLDQPAGALIQAAEHTRVGPHDVFGVLGAHLFGADVGAFHVDAHQVGAALVLVGGGHVHDAVQDLFAEGHGGGADGEHAFAGLKVGNRLQAFGVGVAEIMAHRTVEVDVHQAGQGVQAIGVDDLLTGFGHGMGHDAAVADHQILHSKGVLRGIYLGVANNHSLFLACLVKNPRPGGAGECGVLWIRSGSERPRHPPG